MCLVAALSCHASRLCWSLFPAPNLLSWFLASNSGPSQEQNIQVCLPKPTCAPRGIWLGVSQQWILATMMVNKENVSTAVGEAEGPPTKWSLNSTILLPNYMTSKGKEKLTAFCLVRWRGGRLRMPEAISFPLIRSCCSPAASAQLV